MRSFSLRQNFFKNRLLRSGLFSFSLAFALAHSSSALASKSKEAAITRSWEDSALKWGPAPAFMPQGSELSVLHGNPSKRNADVFLKVPPKAMIPAHWHTSAERMILIAGELHINYVGQEKVILKPGNYAYGPAKLSHDGICASETPCILFIAFESPVDAVPAATSSK